jgi:hypothetical protein
MTFTDIISTLEFNHMLIKKDQTFEIIMSSTEEKQRERLYAKPELLTWVPYMVTTKEGDAGILNIPRHHEYISSSDISIDAIIPSSSKFKKRTRLTRSGRKKVQ